MPFRRRHRTLLALVAVFLVALAYAQPTFVIGLGQSASGVLAPYATTHAYLLDVPTGIAGFTVEVHGKDGGADLAVFYGDEALHDASPEPNAVVAVAHPRAGTYRIVVTNLLAEDLAYFLRAVGDGAALLELDSRVVTSGSTIAVYYSGAPGHERDWIGLFARGADDAAFVSRQLLEGTASGRRVFDAPREAGAYEFRLFANDGDDRIAVSPPFDVAVPVAPSTGPIGHGACETDGKCRAP